MTRYNRQDYKTAIPQIEGDVNVIQEWISSALDFFYPVGTIYETENADFNPNKVWGGTWEKIEGRVLVGHKTDDTYFGNVGNQGGHKGSFYHDHGSRSLTGSWYTAGRFPDTTSRSGIVTNVNGSSSYYFSKNSDSATNAKGFTINATHTHDAVGSSDNTDANISNMPPYEVVVIWKRIK